MHVEIRKKSCRDTGSCWTGFSGSIDVSVACTWVLSVSYQHRWAAKSRVPLQEKPKTTASVLLFFLLHTSHNPWPSASALWRGKPSHWPLLWRTEEIKEVKTNMINPQTLVFFYSRFVFKVATVLRYLGAYKVLSVHLQQSNDSH